MGNLLAHPLLPRSDPLNSPSEVTSPMAENEELGTLVDFLPDKAVRSVLARLAPRSVCRFRAVSRAWRRLLTFDRNFLFEHHCHQPLQAMAAFIHIKYTPWGEVYSRSGVQALNFRTGEVCEIAINPAEHRHISVFEDAKAFKVHGSCNGLLLLNFHEVFFVYNPATRQRASLPPLQSDEVAALYCFNYGAPLGVGVGESYRVLYHRGQGIEKCYYIISDSTDSTLDQRRRRTRAIGRPISLASAYLDLDAALVQGPSPAWARPPLRLCDNLHWPPQGEGSQDQKSHILVFDTVTEEFSWIKAPVVMEKEDTVVLLEMEGKLAMSTCRRGALVVELSILEDYHREIWGPMLRILLPAELTDRFHYREHGFAFIASQDGDVLVSTPQRVMHYNYNKNGIQVKDFFLKGFPHYVTTHLFHIRLFGTWIDLISSESSDQDDST